MRQGCAPFLFDYRRTSAAGAFREVFHAHLEMEFTYIHEGEGLLIIDGTTYSIEPGALLMFQPFQLHRVQIRAASGFVRSLIMFDPAMLKPYWDSFPALKGFFQTLKQQPGSSRPVRSVAEGDPILALLEQFDDARQHHVSNEIHEEYMFFLLSFLRQFRRIGQAAHEQLSEPLRYRHRAEEAMQWIERHYHEPFRLEQMADELHLSRYHIAHLFKEATGTTILAYVQATRIRHACVLLTRTSLTIPEIGARTGIANPSYFCKVFREAMGTTPHQYRLQVQKP
ncbi:AraC family transcriptional regulator [Paenibacillus piri]|uniref:AraC family transcriptional regulator n=1 Tax=Paenibacillus piri TaxID=2547395 RepID=A0A4R5KDG9_9BACL|nr:response regulator transcription factor [Paenibacillus piri]TDF92568.1 AraC family transcriptional regulator [Paenibacillus piri]